MVARYVECLLISAQSVSDSLWPVFVGNICVRLNRLIISKPVPLAMYLFSRPNAAAGSFGWYPRSKWIYFFSVTAKNHKIFLRVFPNTNFVLQLLQTQQAMIACCYETILILLSLSCYHWPSHLMNLPNLRLFAENFHELFSVSWHKTMWQILCWKHEKLYFFKGSSGADCKLLVMFFPVSGKLQICCYRWNDLQQLGKVHWAHWRSKRMAQVEEHVAQSSYALWSGGPERIGTTLQGLFLYFYTTCILFWKKCFFLKCHSNQWRVGIIPVACAPWHWFCLTVCRIKSAGVEWSLVQNARVHFAGSQEAKRTRICGEVLNNGLSFWFNDTKA